jgi:hypothetical protein
MKPIKLWSRDEYSPLKTLLLGDVFDPEDAPPYFPEDRMDDWRQMLREAREDLTNLQLTLEQLGVRVVRPRIPWTWNGSRGKLNMNKDNRWISRAGNDPLRLVPPLNLRDTMMVYGDTLFLSYTSRAGRLYEQHCLADVFAAITQGGGKIAASPMPPLYSRDDEIDPGLDSINLSGIMGDAAQRTIGLLQDMRGPTSMERLGDLKSQIGLSSKNDVIIAYRFKLSGKILFHTASMLRAGDRIYASAMAGSGPGHAWIKNWLESMGAEIIELPAAMHIDGAMSMVDADTMLTVEVFADAVDAENLVRRVIKLPIPLKERPATVMSPLYSKDAREFQLDMAGYPQHFFHNCNIVSVDTTRALCSWYDRDFYAKIRNEAGLELIHVPWRNTYFWEGGLHCITCDLERGV